LLPEPALFLYAFVRKEAVLSSQIEGTQSSLSDLLLFEIEEAPGVPFDDVREVSNYVRALEHGVRRVRENFPISSRLLTRICLDVLKSARLKREEYVGPWLPDPVTDTASLAPEVETELAEDLSVALLLALERLSPLERAAFLLHDVFDYSFAQVAVALGRNEAACRQLAARARSHERETRSPGACGSTSRLATRSTGTWCPPTPSPEST
jgi:hypothetical protein